MSKDSWHIPKYDVAFSATKQHDYCVLVFVINEGEKLHKQLDRMAAQPLNVDIVIADGGSTDGSTDEAVLKAKQVNTLLIKREAGKLGTQMRMGFAWALDKGYRGVVVIDGNNKDSVANINDFVAQLDAGIDHVQGSRFIPGGKAINTPISRLLGLKLIHVPMMRWASGFRYTDTTNGFRAYSRALLESEEMAIFRDVFTSYELHYYIAIQAVKCGFKCSEIPVTRTYPQGKVPTKISPIRGNASVLRTLFKVCFGGYDEK